ncbi:MAG: ABC transporter ATP-binding protein [Clostridiales bacterium]|nr:ABC transporter ATP-binding protein [Eubacterium sp.]MDD7350362.1 ABC transporter ATP-binding protein [Clostridiales bacterium]MDY3773890.1 ABC transporter ATP-binding protein [Eubacterium sp.]
MMIILETKGLTKRFGNSLALDNVDITLECGKIVGLLGPNGSGKTTFLKLINGLLKPDQGTITIGGEAPGVITKQHVSFLPDSNYFPRWMKVTQLLEYFSDFYEDFQKEKASYMLGKLDIDSNMKLSHMSKGTLEKVQLVLAMSRDANLYCLDEPIGGVDPATRDYILNTIVSNYCENSTVLISTHLISDVENVLDEVIFLQNGQVRMQSSVDDIREKENKSVDALFREVFRC